MYFFLNKKFLLCGYDFLPSKSCLCLSFQTVSPPFVKFIVDIKESEW